MPSFAKPRFEYDYDLAKEIAAVRDRRKKMADRAIPPKSADRLLIATWNIANLGEQQRRPKDHALIAEMISWFDLVAVQEVKEQIDGLSQVRAALPKTWRVVYSDTAGNDERMAFLYDSRKVKLREMTGEIAVAPSDLRHVKLPETMIAMFNGFDRNPYIATFEAGGTVFCLVNVHLYFGGEEKASLERRALEAYAVARWCQREAKSKHALTPIIAALGDFNLPKVDPADPIFRALSRTGLMLPKHQTQIGTNLAGDKQYDQVAFFPDGAGARFTGATGVFDFDGAVFADLWGDTDEKRKQFHAYVRYYLSDHRPMWAQFRVGAENPGGVNTP